MFVILLVIAILLLMFAVGFDDNPFWNLTSIVLGIPIWFILGLGQLELEESYVAYNASSGAIESGTEIIFSDISPYLSYIFMIIGILLMIYLIAMVFDHWYNYKNWHGGN